MRVRYSGWWLARVLLTSQHTAVDFLLSECSASALDCCSRHSECLTNQLEVCAVSSAEEQCRTSVADTMESPSSLTLYDEANSNTMKVWLNSFAKLAKAKIIHVNLVPSFLLALYVMSLPCEEDHVVNAVFAKICLFRLLKWKN